MATVGQMVDNVIRAVSGNRPTDELYLPRAQVKYILDFCTCQAIAQYTRESKRLRQYGGDAMHDHIIFSSHTVALEVDAEGVRSGQLPFIPMVLPDVYDGVARAYVVNECTGRSKTIPPITYDRVQALYARPFAGMAYMLKGNTIQVFKAGMLANITLLMAGGDGSIISAVTLKEALNRPYPCPAHLVGTVTQLAVAWIRSILVADPDLANDNRRDINYNQPRVVQQAATPATA